MSTLPVIWSGKASITCKVADISQHTTYDKRLQHEASLAD
jgi:hypothetical protein